MDINSLYKQFLEYLEVEKGRSLKTIENYGRYLKRFLEFSKINEPKEISEELLRKYRLWLNRIVLKNGDNLDKKTQNYYLIGLRVFLKYLAKRDVASLPPDKIELAKTLPRDLDLITMEELQRLLDAPINSPPAAVKLPRGGLTAAGLRDKAVLELLFSTGLRVSELCSLDRDSFGEDRNGEISIRGKGGKIRVVFISESAKQAVKNYLNKRTDMEEALFVGAGGRFGKKIKSAKSDKLISSATSFTARRRENSKLPAENYASRADDINLSQIENTSRLTPRSVERILKRRAIEAGISKKVTPHIIRHCFATDLLSNGADIRSVQAMLGHSNITTTQIYTHVTDKQLREAHKNFHDKSRK